MSGAAALSYEEPGIATILIQSSFLLLLNVVNWILDNAIYCGLLGQVLMGIAWGTPGTGWLPLEVQDTVMQLGYLGLILVIYEGGLSTSFAALWSNLYLSGLVALIGIGCPIALSFVLRSLLDATAVQAFAAGAALCSTSLGTTFTILSTSGLERSRLGVILSSAAMLDDVAGLVMVQVISNLGASSAGVGFSATTVIRPVFVSLAFAVVVPLVCGVVVKPITVHVFDWWGKKPQNKDEATLWRRLKTPAAVFVVHTLILVGLVAGSSYAGTSNLFAAYIAGAVVNWWDALAQQLKDEKTRDNEGETKAKKTTSVQPDIQGFLDPARRASANGAQVVGNARSSQNEEFLSHDGGDAASSAPTWSRRVGEQEHKHNELAGISIYERFYGPAVKFILKPFFFASIGFSIPITQMFSGGIVWRGIVYTILMIMGKLVCGLVLVRFEGLPNIRMPFKGFLRKLSKDGKRKQHEQEQEQSVSEAANVTASPPPDGGLTTFPEDEPKPHDTATTPTPNTSRKRSNNNTDRKDNRPVKSRAKIPKPQSLYPAAMLGSAMVARGEIGFLISSLAESTGVFSSSSSSSSSYSTGQSSEIFLVATWAILLCTVIGPVSVGVMVRRVRRLQKMERERATGRKDPLGIWGVM